MVEAGPAFAKWASKPFSKLAITGVTGWLGQALAEQAVLAGLTVENGRLRLFGSSSREVMLGSRTCWIDALASAEPLGNGDWIVGHFGFLGKERTEDLSPEAFRAANDAIAAEALRLADTAEQARMLFASSGAVYAALGGAIAGANLYGAMKLEHERFFREWAEARGAPLLITRIFNIGGPFINKLDRYALSSIILDAIGPGVITIGARRPVFRSFVDARELCMVSLEALLGLQGGGIDMLDTAGREIVELGDLALTVSRALGRTCEIYRSWDPTATPDWYVGDPKSYLSRVTALGRVPLDLEQIVQSTAAWLKGGARIS